MFIDSIVVVVFAGMLKATDASSFVAKPAPTLSGLYLC